MKNKKNLKERGITLIALVVTIVVLLILAGVTINAVFSDSGIIKKAQEAQNKANESVQKDMEQINALENWLNENTGESNNDKEVNISTLVGKEAVTKNTKAVDAYENKITIPKGFKVLAHNPTSSTGAVTYTYSGDNIPAVQDGIVIEDKDGNQFVWVPVGEIKNKDNTTNTITLGRYSDFTATSGVYTPVQSAENYTKETIMIFGNIQNQDYTIAKLGIKDNKENTIKMNRAIQLEGIINDKMVIKAAEAVKDKYYYKELVTFREGNYDRQENATARNLVEFVSTTLANGGYYIARFEASGTTSKIAYNRVYNVCNLLKDDDVKVYANRIDSTLRGNLGSETDAMLDSLGEDYIAIVAPCFPASGRIICGGYMLVDGLPLHKTNIAVDPKTPVKISEVGELFKQQSKYQVSTIYMKDLMHGKHYLADLMKKCVEEGSRIITLDCITQEDLDLIADAVITSGLKEQWNFWNE